MASRVIAGCGIVCESLLSSITISWNGFGSLLANAVLICFALLVPLVVALGGLLLEPFDRDSVDEELEGVAP